MNPTDDEAQFVRAASRAAAAVEAAQLPDDLRVAAFSTALTRFLGDAPAYTPPPESTVDPGGAGVAAGPSALSRALAVSSELVDRVFDFEGQTLHFSGDVAQTGSNKAERVSNIAILLIAGLKWSGLDNGEPVPDQIVRAEIDNLGLYDVTNYNKHIALLKSYVTIYGSGKNATYKAKYDGLQRARELAQKLVGQP